MQEKSAAGQQYNNYDNPPLYLFSDEESPQHKQPLTESKLQKILKFPQAQQFPPKKKQWWDTLVTQHVKATGDTNLGEIYLAFETFSQDMQTFWEKVYKESFQFPQEFFLADEGNMYVALQRLSHVCQPPIINTA